MNVLNEISSQILRVAFDLYIVILWLRFLLQLLHADFYNPIAQFVAKATAPFVIPLRRIIPGNRSWEPSVLVLIVLFKMLEITLIGLFSGTGTLPPVPLVFVTIIELMGLVFQFYYWTLLISVILSWVAPGGYSPAAALVHQITEPLLAPCRRILPDTGGIDLSPILAFLGLWIAQKLLAAAAVPVYASLGLF